MTRDKHPTHVIYLIILSHDLDQTSMLHNITDNIFKSPNE